MTFAIPTSITAEHQHLHEELRKALSAGGVVAEAVRRVAEVLGPHFKKEESYAMPPLGLLAAIAREEPTPQVEVIVGLTERLRAELPTMLDEHQKIRSALDGLATAAINEKRPDIAAFAERLALHAINEEEVLYPAALLVGRYLEMKRSNWE
jgi:hypothetical protein